MNYGIAMISIALALDFQFISMEKLPKGLAQTFRRIVLFQCNYNTNDYNINSVFYS